MEFKANGLAPRLINVAIMLRSPLRATMWSGLDYDREITRWTSISLLSSLIYVYTTVSFRSFRSYHRLTTIW